jgi:hypothetical protein
LAWTFGLRQAEAIHVCFDRRGTQSSRQPFCLVDVATHGLGVTIKL